MVSPILGFALFGFTAPVIGFTCDVSSLTCNVPQNNLRFYSTNGKGGGRLNKCYFSFSSLQRFDLTLYKGSDWGQSYYYDWEYYWNLEQEMLEDYEERRGGGYSYRKNYKNFEISNKYPFNPIYFLEKKSRPITPRVNRSSGLIVKQRIDSWVKLNIEDFKINELNVNNLFIEKYLLTASECFSVSWSGFEFSSEFYSYLYNELYYFKNNILVKNKSYFQYLLNTPDNLVLYACLDNIKGFYNSRNISKEYKYGIISLYLFLGKNLVDNCLKYHYSAYLDNNNIKVYFKGKKRTPFIYRDVDFLCFKDFKHNIIKNRFNDLDTTDIIEYGRDLYLFTIFKICILKLVTENISPLKDNIHLDSQYSQIRVSSSENYTTQNIRNISSKDIISIINPNIDYYGKIFPSDNWILKAKSNATWSDIYRERKGKRYFSSSANNKTQNLT